MNTNSTGGRAAERQAGPAVRRFAACLSPRWRLRRPCPPRPFRRPRSTSFADGSFEYFFAAPSLDIRGAGDLDLTGLSFIEGVADGFRVGASFNLDWLGGEQAVLASPASTWSGLDGLPRSLSIISGGNIDFETVRLSLPGGTIWLAAGGAVSIGSRSEIVFGGSGVTTLQPRGNLSLQPGGDLSIVSPSPIPEPSTAAPLLAGLLGLAGFVSRR